MRVLIVEDDEASAEMLEHSLTQFGYQVSVARNGHTALEILRNDPCRVVISDWEMPEMSGIELCRRIRERHTGGYVYIILLTARRGTKNVVDGLSAGADDFITKPFHPQELRVRIHAGERILGFASRELTIFSLAKLAESRDEETGAHQDRIREYCRVLAEHLARQAEFRDQVDGGYVQLIYLTSPLHDIGKVGIPDSILLKKGPLTPAEFEVMKQHTLIGSKTLDAAAQAHPEARFLEMARDIARSHHERFDGSGYPDGLAGFAIPLCSRIVAVADVYDALTTQRVYKSAFPHEKSRQLILDGSGTQFDPAIVRAFVENEDRFQAIRRQFADRDGAQVLSAMCPAPHRPGLRPSARPLFSA